MKKILFYIVLIGGFENVWAKNNLFLKKENKKLLECVLSISKVKKGKQLENFQYLAMIFKKYKSNYNDTLKIKKLSAKCDQKLRLIKKSDTYEEYEHSFSQNDFFENVSFDHLKYLNRLKEADDFWVCSATGLEASASALIGLGFGLGVGKCTNLDGGYLPLFAIRGAGSLGLEVGGGIFGVVEDNMRGYTTSVPTLNGKQFTSVIERVITNGVYDLGDNSKAAIHLGKSVKMVANVWFTPVKKPSYRLKVIHQYILCSYCINDY